MEILNSTKEWEKCGGDSKDDPVEKIFDGKNYSNKLYIGETGRWLGGRFQEHLRNIETNDKDASKAVTGRFNHHIPTNSVAPLSTYQPTIPPIELMKG